MSTTSCIRVVRLLARWEGPILIDEYLPSGVALFTIREPEGCPPLAAKVFRVCLRSSHPKVGDLGRASRASHRCLGRPLPHRARARTRRHGHSVSRGGPEASP